MRRISNPKEDFCLDHPSNYFQSEIVLLPSLKKEGSCSNPELLINEPVKGPLIAINSIRFGTIHQYPYHLSFQFYISAVRSGYK